MMIPIITPLDYIETHILNISSLGLYTFYRLVQLNNDSLKTKKIAEEKFSSFIVLNIITLGFYGTHRYVTELVEKRTYIFNLMHSGSSLKAEEDPLALESLIEIISKTNQCIEKNLLVNSNNNQIQKKIEEYPRLMEQLDLSIPLLKNQIKEEENRFETEKRSASKDLVYERGLGPLKQLTTKDTTTKTTSITQVASLLESTFIECFQRLISVSKQNNVIQFNHSALIINDEYKENRFALHSFLIFQLIQDADEISRNGSTHLSWKGKNVEMHDAQYTKMLTRIQNQHGGWKLEEFIRPVERDSWITSNISPKGMDPMRLKTILSQLTTDEKDLLKMILLEPLIPRKSIALEIANIKLKKLEISKQQLLLDSCELIHNMASIISYNFEDTFNSCWQMMADEYEEKIQPLLKNEKSILNIKKTELIEWKPVYDCITDNEIREYLTVQRALLSPVWKNMDSLLEKPQKKGSILSIQAQYNILHIMIGKNNGCLLSSLIRGLIPIHIPVTNRMAFSIRSAMANYLAIHRDRFESRLNKQWTHISYEDYQGWLRGKNSKINERVLSEFEIELFAYTFGICVEVVEKSLIALDDSGRVTGCRFGPDTCERVVLYHTQNATYFAAFPMLKPLKEIQKGELEESVRCLEPWIINNNKSLEV